MSEEDIKSAISCDQKTAELLISQGQMYEEEFNNTATNDLLKNFLENAAQTLSCGPSCQNTKTSNALLKKYQQAQMTLFQAPDELQATANDYYTFSRGEKYAQEFEEEKLREVADKLANEYLAVFDEIANMSQTLATFYESNETNLKNTRMLEKEFDEQYKTAERDYYDTKNTATTSDRKAYYEDQEIVNLAWWNKIYYYLYIII